MRSIAAASFVYFALVFAVGFVFGVVRVVWLLPALGERHAELIELPLMLIVSFVAAGFAVKRYRIATLRSALLVGALALIWLLAAEFAFVLGLRGLTIEQYVAARDPVAGLAYAAALVVFGVLPAIRKIMISGAHP